MSEAIAIQVITVCGMALGGLAFGLCLGFGMWATGVKMVVTTVSELKGHYDE